MKVNELEIEGFRGIRKNIKINLTPERSILIYGDNGSGKSSIADAFEWFYYDKIEHLSYEEIGNKGIPAIRNIFLSDDEAASVSLNYSDSKYNSEKKLFYKKSKLVSDYSNKLEDFQIYLKNSLKENLILRYKDLFKFILSTKKERLDEISDIIGFSEVSKIKNVLKKQ